MKNHIFKSKHKTIWDKSTNQENKIIPILDHKNNKQFLYQKFPNSFKIKISYFKKIQSWSSRESYQDTTSRSLIRESHQDQDQPGL